jgi:hypothetical protein
MRKLGADVGDGIRLGSHGAAFEADQTVNLEETTFSPQAARGRFDISVSAFGRRGLPLGACVRW